MDDTLSILASLIWVLALGMWPVGFMFGMCSPCCETQCPWLINFQRCLRVSVVGSDPPSGGDCRLTAFRTGGGTGTVYMSAQPIEIHRVASRISIVVRTSLSASGSSRTPVGETRTQTWRFVRQAPTSPPPSAYDVLGPAWHLQVDLTVTGVATAAEAGVTSSISQDEHGQPKLVLHVNQWTSAITHDATVTLFPVGLQRWGPGFLPWQSFRLTTASASATLVSGASYSGWSVQKPSGLTIEDFAIAVSLSGNICAAGGRGNIPMRVILDADAAAAFLSGDEDLRVSVPGGQRDLRVMPDNTLCGTSSNFVGIGIGLGIYPREIYADLSPEYVGASNPAWCGQQPVTFALDPNPGYCPSYWAAPEYRAPNISATPSFLRVVVPQDFWAGFSLLWNLEHGPYRTSFPEIDLTYTYRLGGPQGNLDPFLLSEIPPGRECRPGFVGVAGLQHTCFPESVLATVSGNVTVNVYRDINTTPVCSTPPVGTAQISVSGTVTLSPTAQPSGVSGVSHLDRFGVPPPAVVYSGSFGVAPFTVEVDGSTFSVTGASVSVWAVASTSCNTPSTNSVTPFAHVFFGSAIELPSSSAFFATPGLIADLCVAQTGGIRTRASADLTGSAILIPLAHALRRVCGPWEPSIVPADNRTAIRTCQITDGEYSEAATTETSTSPFISRYTSVGTPDLIGGAKEGGVVTQLGGCRLLGLQSSDSLTPASAIVFASAAAGQCFSYAPAFGVSSGLPCLVEVIENGLPVLYSDALTTFVPCGGCTPAVAVVSGAENASVRYITDGDKAGVIEVVAGRTWRAGEGVTFAVTCGPDTITQVIRRADGVPEAVTALTATRGPCDTFLLAWTAPHDGGRPITDYTVQYRSINANTWITLARPASAATTATISGLLRLGYEFRVAAVNSLGAGPFATVSVGFAISAPVNLVATRGPCDQVALTWPPPQQDACIVVASYRVEFRAVGASAWTVFESVAGNVTTATVTGLDPATAYQFRVARIDDANTAAFSPTARAGEVPPAPINVIAVAGNSQATLTWEGGEDPCIINTNHTVQFRPTATSTWSTFGNTGSSAKTATVTGLTNGVQYRFRVRAINSAGNGSYSAESNAVTPTA